MSKSDLQNLLDNANPSLNIEDWALEYLNEKHPKRGITILLFMKKKYGVQKTSETINNMKNTLSLMGVK